MLRIQKGEAIGGLAFDADKFAWELNFFKEHFLRGLRGAQLTDSESELLDHQFRKLAEELAARPKVLTIATTIPET